MPLDDMDYRSAKLTAANLSAGALHTLIWGGVIDTSTNAWVFANAYTKYVFHTLGRYWVFFAHSGQLGFTSSRDGLTWAGTTDVRACDAGIKFATAFDGKYFHYCYSSLFAATDLYYRRGLPNVDGTITWDAERVVETTPAGHSHVDPDIEIDSNGYPWIVWGEYWAAAPWSGQCYVAKSSTKDGTWTTEFNQLITATTFTDAATPVCWAFIVALSNGRMYAFAEGRSPAHPIEGRLWTGVGWDSVETVTTTTRLPGNQCAVVDDNDNIHFIIRTAAGIYYKKRTYGIGWGSESLVWNVNVAPRLSINRDTNTLYLILAEDDTTGIWYYRKCADGAWDTSNTELLVNPEILSAAGKVVSHRAYDGKIILGFRGKAGSPYDVNVAVLHKVPA